MTRPVLKEAILLVLLLLLPSALRAADMPAFDYTAFSRIPVLHDGRIKPLDSFARVLFKRITGDSSPPHGSASQWLANVLFMPAVAMKEPFFSVRSPDLISMLSLAPSADGRYNFSDLAAAIAAHRAFFATLAKKDKHDFTPEEQALTSLYNNVDDFADIMGTLSLLMPLPDMDSGIRRELGVPDEKPVSYLDLLKSRRTIEARETDTLARKGDRVNSYTSDELQMAKLSARLTLIENMDRNNTLLRIIPPFWGESEEWLSPWAVVEKGAGSPQSIALFSDWRALSRAYRENNPMAWQSLSRKLAAAGATAGGARPWALSLEVIYNDLGLLNKSLFAYALAFGLALGSLLRNSGRLRVAAYALLLAGTTSHFLAMAARVAILMRPPVATLYESMVFVSFVAALAGLWLGRRGKEIDGLLIGGGVACLLLAIANVFAADSDTLEVLTAVLNTNFWLATHVLCITTGYGSALMAGTMAHLYLFRRVMKGTQAGGLDTLQRRIHSVALIALLFTAVGTMLGGIWADQSWGRFWGWDPKENGALLIVLWLVWLLHARVAKQLGPLGFAVGVALLNIVVALAWVGVNLLGVGLHSYGFTNLAAGGLLAFCSCELIFIIGAMGFVRQNSAKS